MRNLFYVILDNQCKVKDAHKIPNISVKRKYAPIMTLTILKRLLDNVLLPKSIHFVAKCV